MDEVFQECIDKFVIVFIDDILVAEIENLEQPRTVIEIQSFLSLAGYRGWFVKDFSVIALPLTRLTRTEVMLEWEDNCAQMFQQLKYFLTHTRILALPEDSGNYEVFIDASLGDREIVATDALDRKAPVRPILVDCILVAHKIDEGIQELTEAELDGMFMQENGTYVPNYVELKKAILTMYTVKLFSVRSSMGMKPFEALFGKDCSTPLCWAEVVKRVLAGPEVMNESTWNVRLSPWRGVVRFGKKGKLSPRYTGPYLITERVGEDVYRLELPSELSSVHNVFHVSEFRHYVTNPSHVIPLQPLELNLDLCYEEEPMTILDRKDKVLKNKTMSLVKVLWRNHSVEEATWETEDRMREMYPRLFYEY
ncbi:uncharacterized protein [Malus domestica]|uniref:uncharacterized protein n=1 Tax=Malus domestica TaxID=3750 RepID=UPI0039765F78